jgi:hypothetical protein
MFQKDATIFRLLRKGIYESIDLKKLQIEITPDAASCLHQHHFF